MFKRDEDVPLFAYLVAVLAGLFFTIFLFFFIGFLLELLETGPYEFDPLAPAVAIVLSYALVGGVFGLVWPEPRWRWGVWLSAGPVCLVSSLGPNALSFAGFIALTLLPSCACAYAAARLHLKYVEAG